MSRRVLFCAGGSSGIGRGVCLLFFSRGYNVAVVDVDECGAEETTRLMQATTLECQDVQAIALKCDVTVTSDIEAAMAATVERFGRLDAAVNCSGVEGDRARIAEYSEETFVRVNDVNYHGIFRLMQVEIRQMLKQEQISKDCMCGHIVNISSTAGLAAFPEFSAYCGSKWAILGLTKCAAAEYVSDGIKVNAICPSTTCTPMVERFAERWPEWQAKMNASYPIGRICSVEEVAEAAWFLCSDACNFHIGEPLILGGGATC